MRSTIALLVLSLVACALAQTAAPFPSVVYTYQGGGGLQSPADSLLNVISTAGAPAREVDASSAGPDSATAVIPAFPTTATQGPVTVPQLTSGLVLGTGGSGEIKSTATRPPFTASGTINTSMAQASAAATSSRVSAASKGVQGASLALGVGMAMTVVGMAAGAGLCW